MLINSIDDKNGMFYFVPKNIIDENSKLPFEKNLKNSNLKDKWRNYDKTIYQFAEKKKMSTILRKQLVFRKMT